jgi:hypothetical protein
MELVASKENPPLGAIIVAKLVNKNIQVKWDNATSMSIGDGVILTTGPSIARYFKKQICIDHILYYICIIIFKVHGKVCLAIAIVRR